MFTGYTDVKRTTPQARRQTQTRQTILEHARATIAQRGMAGLSDKPTDWSYLPVDHAANLAALIDGLGLKDIAFREKELKRWEGAFPTARTARLSSVGHFVQEEAPDELGAAVVPFLNRLVQRQR